MSALSTRRAGTSSRVARRPAWMSGTPAAYQAPCDPTDVIYASRPVGAELKIETKQLAELLDAAGETARAELARHLHREQRRSLRAVVIQAPCRDAVSRGRPLFPVCLPADLFCVEVALLGAARVTLPAKLCSLPWLHTIESVGALR